MGNTTKDTLRSRLGFRDSILRVFEVPVAKKVYPVMLVSMSLFLMIGGFESGCLGLDNQAVGMRCIAEINFRSSWISHDSSVHFSVFWVAFGPIFMTFVALETGFKMITFQSDSGVTPDPGNPPAWW